MRKILLVSNDAGGAEILSCWYAKNKQKYFIFCCVDGPAKKIFKRDHSNDLNFRDLNWIEKLSSEDFVLTGSSLESDLERLAIQKSKFFEIFCITFLDHWINFKVRFGSNPFKNIPDEIWVGDQYAYDIIIQDGFPRNRIKLVENPYFKKIQEYPKKNILDENKILYVCESFSCGLNLIGTNISYDYDDEKQNLDQFLKAIIFSNKKIDLITVRLHPSENRDKYNDIIKRYQYSGLSIILSEQSSIIDDINDHNIIVGMESMGLIVGVLMNRKVISCITGRKKWNIRIPHQEIIRIHCFDDLYKHI